MKYHCYYSLLLLLSVAITIKCQVPTTRKTRAPISVHTTQTYKPSSQKPTDPGYAPCETFISISADNSMTLTSDNLQTELNFIATIFGGMNHPERLMYSYRSNTPVLWFSQKSISDIQSIVLSTPSYSGIPYSLSTTLETIYGSMLFDFNYTLPINTLVFISDTSDPSNYIGADRYARILKHLNVKITLVLMGNNVNQNLLTNITDSFITWKDLSQPKPDNWDNLYGPLFGCKNGISTINPITIPTTTTQATKPTTSTSPSPVTTVPITVPTITSEVPVTTVPITVPETTTTPTVTTTTASTNVPSTTTGIPQSTPTPAYTCNSHIPFGMDLSATLTSDQYNYMKQFILDPFITTVMPDGKPAPWVFYSTTAFNFRANTKDALRNIVNITAQGTNPRGVMSAAFEKLESLNALGFTDDLPINTIMFTGTELIPAEISDLQTSVTDFLGDNKAVIVVFMTNTIDASTTLYNNITGLTFVNYNPDPKIVVSDLERLMKCKN